jgi:hypothetical protein
MNESAFFPFSEDADRLERYCKLPLHSGVGIVMSQGDSTHPLIEMFRQAREAIGIIGPDPAKQQFAASFLVPATANCLLIFRWPSACPLNRNFGQGLTVAGDCSDGLFRLECPEYYVRLTSGPWEEPGWAIAESLNHLATVTYGDSRPIARVTATINNFDFDYGNLALGQDKVLRVEAAGRTVDFMWRKERVQLRRLVDAGIIASTALVTFSFATRPGEAEGELTTLAQNVASLCSYVVGQHTGVPVLSFFDAEDRVVRRTLGQAIESEFRRWCVLPCLHSEDGLPKLFRQCFTEHVRMQGSDLWRRLPFLCAGIEDPPYLEQKYASLMMGVELLIRSSLIESGHLTPEEAESKNLPGLVGMARGTLRWDVPSHYTEKERYRTVRNAVDHGGRLPHDPAQVRYDFDKWRLFLLRRILIRLGYDGKVASPQQGLASSSPIDEFSEKHNSFRP